MDNPFSWDYLTTVPGPNEDLGTFATIFLVIIVAGFILSLVVYNGWAKSLFDDPVLHRMARRWAGMGLIVCTTGIFLCIIRVLQINPLNLGMRIWLWLCGIALVALIVYIVYDYRKHYEAARTAYEEEMLRKRYAHAGASSVTALGKSEVFAGTRAPRPKPVVRRKRT